MVLEPWEVVMMSVLKLLGSSKILESTEEVEMRVWKDSPVVKTIYYSCSRPKKIESVGPILQREWST